MNDLIESKKTDFKANHLKIIDEYTSYVEEHMKAPKITELAEICKLSRATIYKHLKQMQLSEISNKYKIRAISILDGIAKKAEEGDVQAAKLIFQLAFNWNEKKILDVQSTNRSIKVVFTNPDSETMNKIANTVPTSEPDDTNYEEVDED